MNKKQEESYRNLISGVLTYPERSALILDANPDLLDYGLMEVMEQVAATMAANSSTEAASFLQNLMSQLKDELIPTRKKTASLLKTQEITSDEDKCSHLGGLALMLSNIIFILVILL